MIDENIRQSINVDPPRVAEPGALPDRHELSLVAFERTQMPMVVTDPRLPDNPIVLANQAFLDMTGYAADEVVGRNCRFLQGPLTAQPEVDAIREALAERRHSFVELLNYRKDGSTFWNRLLLSAVESEAGELLYFFGSQQDVTARKRAEDLEAAERLLLMEVDHRAMNALALVQSIVRLSHAEDIRTYAASIRGRVDALASAHRLLARHRWTGASLAELIHLATSAHCPPRVRAEGVEVMLAAETVQPLALVLHELLANAQAHGALAGPDGSIAIYGDVMLDKLRVRWIESGSECPNAEPQARFGLGIVTGVIERQLGGTVTLDWTDDGLQAELLWPQAELAASPQSQ